MTQEKLNQLWEDCHHDSVEFPRLAEELGGMAFGLDVNVGEDLQTEMQSLLRFVEVEAAVLMHPAYDPDGENVEVWVFKTK